MPLLGAIVLLIQFCFAFHALKTGRPYWWLFVIMGFPVMGCVIYYFVEVFPRTRESAKAERAISKAVSNLSRAIDPEKEMRQRIAEAELNPSIDNKIALARECVVSGMPGEAVKLYRSCLEGAFARDPNIRFGLLEAEIGAGEYTAARAAAEALLRENAGFKDGDVRLFLARALERSGDVNAAEGAYADAVKVFRGEEARYRYAAMLKSLGQSERANALFRELIKNAERSPRFYKDAQSEWIKAAKRDLAV
jgi:hypothetical protein